ncbi:MAG: 2-C-methyl-D-erythritol 2,4-cyclodiphosphate synthase [Gemmatimonadota bacterium]
MRVGFGYDSHRFDPGRPLVLGGVHIPGAPGLTGFSDGDAVAHAVTDAILGAAGAGDIGRHFPPGDERWRDADSIDLLERAVAIVHGLGLRVVNVDVTVICESPRIGPRAEAMCARLAMAMAIDADLVSVKGKTNEGMGWIGAGEGLAVHAVALVDSGHA